MSIDTCEVPSQYACEICDVSSLLAYISTSYQLTGLNSAYVVPHVKAHHLRYLLTLLLDDS